MEQNTDGPVAGAPAMPSPSFTWAARHQRLTLSLLLALAVVALYLPSVRYGFVWDDTYYVLKNTTIRTWSTWLDDLRSIKAYAGMINAPMFRPVRNWSYRLDWSLAGPQPSWWHAHNVLLHALNAVLVFHLLLVIAQAALRQERVVRRPAPIMALSFVAALAWAFHPVQTEAVCWVKSRDELLFTLFSLVAILAGLSFARDPRLRASRLAVAIVCAALALLSKEMAACLPLLFGILAFWGARARRRQVRLLWLSALTAVEVIAFVAWRHRVLGATAMCDYLSGNFYHEMLTMVRAFARYVSVSLWPARLVADYSHFDPTRSLAEPRWWFALAMLAAPVVIAVSARRRMPLVSIGFTWFFLALAPVSNVIPTMQYLAERFLYFPLIGLAMVFLGVCLWLQAVLESLPANASVRLLPSRSLRSMSGFLVAFLAALTITALAGRTVLRMGEWRDELSLHAATLRDAPRNGRALLNVVMALANRASSPRDIEMAEQWLDLLRRSNDPVLRRVNMQMWVRAEGAVAMRQGRFREAQPLWERALQYNAEDVDALIALGICHGLQGRDQQALECFLRAAQVDPLAPQLKENVIVALQQLGRTSEAQALLSGKLTLTDIATTRPR